MRPVKGKEYEVEIEVEEEVVEEEEEEELADNEVILDDGRTFTFGGDAVGGGIRRLAVGDDHITEAHPDHPDYVAPDITNELALSHDFDVNFPLGDIVYESNDKDDLLRLINYDD